MPLRKLSGAVLCVVISSNALAYNPLEHFGAGFQDLADRQNLITLGVGGALTLAALQFDQQIVDHYSKGDPWGGAGDFGKKFLGTGIAGTGIGLTTLVYGLAAKKNHAIDSGQAHLEALLTTGVITGLLKVTVRRERPGGGHRSSFPSGHTSTVFASAMIMHEMYRSPVIDIVSYSLAAYTAAGRIVANRHHLSDVIFGATLGTIVAHGFAQHHLRQSANGEGAEVPVAKAQPLLWMPYFDSRDNYGLSLSKLF